MLCHGLVAGAGACFLLVSVLCPKDVKRRERELSGIIKKKYFEPISQTANLEFNKQRITPSALKIGVSYLIKK